MPRRNKAVRSTAKSKAPQRKRRNRRNNGSAPAVVSRTTNQVQQDLRRPRATPTPMKREMDKYLRCRLDPFNSSSGMIPDGSSTRRVMVDHRSYADIAASESGSSFVFRTFPSLPYFGMMKAGSEGFTLNGSPIKLVNPVDSFGWVPTLIGAEYYGTGDGNRFNPTNLEKDNNNPFSASRFRIVTQAVRITYTGPAASASGLVTVRSTPISLLSKNSNVLFDNAFINWTTGLASVNAGGSTRGCAVSWDNAAGTATVDDYSCRPETGVQTVVKHNGDYEWQDYSVNAMVLYPSDHKGNSLICSNGNGPSSSGGFQYHGVIGVDTNWDSVEFEFTSLNREASFRIESVLCVEYEIQPTSTFARLAQKPPPENPMAVRAADSALSRAPIAYPGSRNLLSSAVKTLAGAAPTVGSAFGPYGTAVGTAVDAFARMVL